jgi:hypothetical protein
MHRCCIYFPRNLPKAQLFPTQYFEGIIISIAIFRRHNYFPRNLPKAQLFPSQYFEVIIISLTIFRRHNYFPRNLPKAQLFPLQYFVSIFISSQYFEGTISSWSVTMEGYQVCTSICFKIVQTFNILQNSLNLYFLLKIQQIFTFLKNVLYL